MDEITTCGSDEYATMTYQGIVCKGTEDTWEGEHTADHHCKSEEFLKITPMGIQCFPFSNKTSTYTTYCADCCYTGEFAVITTLGLRCAGNGCTQDSDCTGSTPACDTTINRCVPCNEDTHCRRDRNAYCNNQNKCEVCVPDSAWSCNAERTKRSKSCRLSDGTIKNTQNLSCSLAQFCKSGQCVTPANCTTTTQSWTHNSRTCQAPLPATRHKQEVTVTDTTEPDTGEATYRCFDGSWEKQRSGCGNTCPTTTQSWEEDSTTCTAEVTRKLPGQSITVTDTTGTEQGTATYVCDGVSWVKEQGTCGLVCPAESVSWTVGTNSCTASLPLTQSGDTATAEDTTGSPQGTATYTCNNSTWELQTGATCSRPCSSTTKDNCTLSTTVSGSSSGSCASGYSGSCSYSCSDGVWSRKSNSCTTYSPPSYRSSPPSYGGGFCTAKATTISGCAIDSSGDGFCTDCYRHTGNRGYYHCVYTCEGSSWREHYNNCVWDGCPGTTTGNCYRPSTCKGSSSGSCASGYSGSCSYTCNSDGSWTENSNSCAAMTGCSYEDGDVDPWYLYVGNCGVGVPASGQASFGSSRTGTCSTPGLGNTACSVICHPDGKWREQYPEHCTR